MWAWSLWRWSWRWSLALMFVMLLMRVEVETSGWRRRVGRRWSLGLAPTLPPPLGSGLSGHVLLSLQTPALPLP